MPSPDKLSSQDQTSPVPIVAIGTSADGVDAVVELVTNLSATTNLAFVCIQHPGGQNESGLVDMLSQQTPMPVLEAEDQMAVEANHVYVIPPNKVMEVGDGMLRIAPNRPEPAYHLPIDQFLVTLAERQQAASIAIILSSHDSDGMVGLKAIKAAGGITFAQPLSSQWEWISTPAQSEGIIDKVFPPKEIAQELEWLSQQHSLFQQTLVADNQEEVLIATESRSDGEELGNLLQLLRKIIGIDFSHYKVATIRRRVVRRMALYKLTTLPDYTEYLRQHPAEAGLLYNDLLINVTSFFRDAETMEYLGNVLIPELIKAKSANEPFRLWVTACSTGEEVYSLAILLLEALEELNKPMPVQIFATDLSERVIGRARLGLFSANQVAGVSQKRLKRFFVKEETDYRISKVVRDLCVFAPHNVFVDPPFSRIDLISCRNLLIYTDTVLQRKAIATFHYALNTVGYLVLGKAETVGASTNLFTQVAKNYKLYARKNNGYRSVMPMVSHAYDRWLTTGQKQIYPTPPPQSPVNSTDNGSPVRAERSAGNEKGISYPRTMQTPGHADDLDQRVEELLKRYTPASVVVNKDLEILRFRGATSLFLEPAPGKANFNLLKMVRPELVFDLRNAVTKALKSGQPVTKTGLQMHVREQLYYVALHAVPFQSQNKEPFILVLFEEVQPTVLPHTPPAQLRNQRIKELEAELATLRDDMRSMLEEQEASREELQSANEEIISSNEELQSINEELETSKEEIQSNNEELQTINHELQLSNDQLSEAYDYSDAIFGTIRETVLVLDKDLRVRSANRAFYKTFRMEPDETTGRLFYELNNRQWDIPALRELLNQVIEHNTPIQGYEINHSFPELGDKVLRFNARKVIRLQGQAAILLAIEDITDQKHIQRLLKFVQSIIAHAPVSIRLFRAVRNDRGLIIDFLLVPLAEELSQQEFQTVEALYKNSYKALYTDTEQSALFTKYVDVVETGASLQLEIPYLHADQNGWYLISANRFNDGFLLVTSDISDRKRAEEAVHQQEVQLRRLLENTPDVITRWDKNRRLVYANAAFEEKIGTPTSALLGLTNLEMGQPELIALPYMASLQEVLDTGKPKEHYNFYPKGEDAVFFHSRMVPELGTDGSVEGVLAIARDITQLNDASNLKQAYERIQQAALEGQQQAERLQSILDSCQAAILTLSPVYAGESANEPASLIDFRIDMVNQSITTLISQPAVQFPGTLISQLFPVQHDRANLLNHCIQTYLTGKPQRFEWQYVESTTKKWLDMSIVRVKEDLLITFTDFTELKQLHQQLEKLVVDLQRSNNSLEQFAYVASHDLQEPLRKIQQFGTIIQTNYGPLLGEDGANLINRMQASSTRLQVLIKDILAYSKLSAKRDVFKAVDINTVVDGVLADLETAINEHQAVLTVQPLPTIQGDQVQLRQLFQNLISNALKFVSPGRRPHINITSEIVSGGQSGFSLHPGDENRTFVLIDIIDNGIGFFPEQAELIFQAFQRLHGKKVYTGTGIGLAIVQKVVENHQGYILAEGRPGEGATFRILLPVSH